MPGPLRGTRPTYGYAGPGLRTATRDPAYVRLRGTRPTYGYAGPGLRTATQDQVYSERQDLSKLVFDGVQFLGWKLTELAADHVALDGSHDARDD